MKAVFFSLCIVLGFGIFALGSGSPDFSGNWIGDVVKTDSILGLADGKAELTTRKLMVMAVKQQGVILNIESVWSDNSTTRVSYILDGNEHSLAEQGGNSIVYQAKVNADQLLIQTTRNIKTPFGGVERQTKEEWVLSEDSNNLTVTATGISVSGNQSRKETLAQIFTRQ